jgi:hypothetical protein
MRGWITDHQMGERFQLSESEEAMMSVLAERMLELDHVWSPEGVDISKDHVLTAIARAGANMGCDRRGYFAQHGAQAIGSCDRRCLPENRAAELAASNEHRTAQRSRRRTPEQKRSPGAIAGADTARVRETKVPGLVSVLRRNRQSATTEAGGL